MIRVLIACIIVNISILKTSEIDFFGHFGIQSSTILSDGDKNYVGASAAFGLDSLFDNGIMIGVGGWASIPIYEDIKKNTSDIYKNIFVLSDFYFSYFENSVELVIGRYDANNLHYEWLSGYNEGISLGYSIGDFIKIWSFYSYRQAFQFIKNNRELYGQINALWDFKQHKTYEMRGNSHLFSLGINFDYENILSFNTYLYYATNDLIASGFGFDVYLGNVEQFYSNTSIKYTYVDESTKQTGHLILFDQEFGFDWFKIGAGYYKTINNGVGRLIRFGDTSRFYGGVVFANETNIATGSYFGKNQSTWYIFTGINNDFINIDLLYANGGYKELSAMISLSLFEHLEFGAGYVNLNKINNDKRDVITSFIKAVW